MDCFLLPSHRPSSFYSHSTAFSIITGVLCKQQAGKVGLIHFLRCTLDLRTYIWSPCWVLVSQFHSTYIYGAGMLWKGNFEIQITVVIPICKVSPDFLVNFTDNLQSFSCILRLAGFSCLFWNKHILIIYSKLLIATTMKEEKVSMTVTIEVPWYW